MSPTVTGTVTSTLAGTIPQSPSSSAPAPVSHESQTSLILSTIAAALAILFLLIYIVRSLWKWRNKTPCDTPSDAQTRRMDRLEKALPSEQSSFTASTRPSADARSQRTFVGRSSVSTRHLPSTPTSRTVSIDDQPTSPVHTKRPTSLEISYCNLLAASPFSKQPKPLDGDRPPSHTGMHGGFGSFFNNRSIRPFHPNRDRSQATASTDIELDVIINDVPPTRSLVSPALPTLHDQIVPKLGGSFLSPLTNGSLISNGVMGPRSSVNANVSKNGPAPSSCKTDATVSAPASKIRNAVTAKTPEFRATPVKKNVDDAHEDIKRAYTDFMNMVNEGVFDDPPNAIVPQKDPNQPEDVLASEKACTSPLGEDELGGFNSRIMSLLIGDLASHESSIHVDANVKSPVSELIMGPSAMQGVEQHRDLDLGTIHEVSADYDDINALGISDTTWNFKRGRIDPEESQVSERRLMRQMLPEPVNPIKPISPLTPLFSPALSSGSSKAPSSATSIGFSTPSTLSTPVTPFITPIDEDERPFLVPPDLPSTPNLPSPNHKVPSTRTAKGWIRVDELDRTKRRPEPLDLTHSISGDMGLQKVELDSKGYRAIGFGRAASLFTIKNNPVNQIRPRSSQSTGSLYSRDTDQGGESSNHGLRTSRSSSTLAKRYEAAEETHIFMRSRRRSKRPALFSAGRSRKSHPPPPNPVLPPELEAVYPHSDQLDHPEGPHSPYFKDNVQGNIGNKPAGSRTSIVESIRDTLGRIPSFRKLVGTELSESTTSVAPSPAVNKDNRTREHAQTNDDYDNNGNLSNVSKLRASDDLFVIGDDSDRLDSP